MKNIDTKYIKMSKIIASFYFQFTLTGHDEQRRSWQEDLTLAHFLFSAPEYFPSIFNYKMGRSF